MHGNEKIASNIEQILMYLVKVFPQVNKHVFNDEKQKNAEAKMEYHDKMSRYLKWVQKCLTPYVAKLFEKIEDDAELKQNASDIKDYMKFLEEHVLKRLEKFLLENSSTDFFSDMDEPNAIDIIMHGEVQQILGLCSTKHKLSKDNYPKLSVWNDKMLDEREIKKTFQKAVEILREKKFSKRLLEE